MSKYTISKDGIPRTTMRLNVRLTKQQLEELKSIAKHKGEKPREWAEYIIQLAIDDAINKYDGD